MLNDCRHLFRKKIIPRNKIRTAAVKVTEHQVMKRNSFIVALTVISICAGLSPTHAGNEGLADTSFKRDNPNLLYTTRDYYIFVPNDCYGGNLCINDFGLVMTFNIGMDSKKQVKQIGFHSADLDLYSKSTSGGNYVMQQFSNYKPVSTQDGWKVNVAFYPDKTNSTVKGVVQKCVFDGTVDGSGISGKLTFYTTTGNVDVIIN